MPETSDYSKLINHILIIGTASKRDKLVFLVEKKYLENVGKDFFGNLAKEIKRYVKEVQVVFYSVDKITRKAIYFYNNRLINFTSLKKFLSKSDVCYDFIASGEAFYKKNSEATIKLIRQVWLVRFYPVNFDFYSYSEREVNFILEYTNLVIKTISQNDSYSIKDLQVSRSGKNYFYTGFNSNEELSRFKVGQVRLLPLSSVTLFTSSNDDRKVSSSDIEINGFLNQEVLWENITRQEETKRVFIEATVNRNKVINLKIDGGPYKPESKFKIVHLTFGANPYIQFIPSRVEVAERKRNWVCIGIEDEENTHIDICFESKLQGLTNWHNFTMGFKRIGKFLKIK